MHKKKINDDYFAIGYVFWAKYWFDKGNRYLHIKDLKIYIPLEELMYCNLEQITNG